MRIIIKVRQFHSDGDCSYPIPDIPPVEGAYQMFYTYTDKSFRQPIENLVAKIKYTGEPYIDRIITYEKPPKDWYDKGTDHRVEESYYVRDICRFVWAIDIDTLEEFFEKFHLEEIDEEILDGIQYNAVTKSLY